MIVMVMTILGVIQDDLLSVLVDSDGKAASDGDCQDHYRFHLF